MKKDLGSLLALYPTPVTVIGAMNGEKPTWTLTAALSAAGKIDYRSLKPVLFEFPTYQYLRTGEVIGKCLSFNQ